MNIDDRLSIGSLADAAGVKVVTIRYYEKVKLMPAPPRSRGNYRAYKREHLHRLRFIRRCRDLGFTLDQVRELLRLSVQGKQGCSDVDRIASKHLENVERKIDDLRKLAAELHGINRQCPGNQTIAVCRILEALSSSNTLSGQGDRPGLAP
jgi:DNA-binding transcriptional MerR regulator